MPSLTRRRLLQASAAAIAAGALRPPAPALAGPAPLFELGVDGELGRAATAAAGAWRTTRPLAAPRRFDLLGVRWAAGGGALEAQVRTRRRRGDWSAWMTLPAAPAHAPDGRGPRTATEPAYTGAADLFQLRWRGDASGVRMCFVRAQPTARAAGRLSARAARASQSPRVSAPPVVPREAWGASAVRTRGSTQYGAVQVAFVHHTVGTNDYGPEESAGIVLAIMRYHVGVNGWNDIGYNFLVDRYGQVFEGRAGGIEQAVVGAQAQGYNAVSTGIACLGTFSSEPQSAAGLESLARLIGWKLSLHGVPVTGQVTVASAGGAANRYPEGTPVTLERISGHRDGDATSCPGDQLYAQLPALRTQALRHAGPIAGISMRAATAVVRHPDPFGFSGTLRFAEGPASAGQPVNIEFQPEAGGSWRRIDGAVTEADGSWEAAPVLPGSGSVRASYAGDDVHPPLTSALVDVRVLPVLRLARLRTARPGARVRVAGTVTPQPVSKAIVSFERRVGRRWLRIKRRRVRVRAGVLEFDVRPRAAGLHRVTVEADGTVLRRSFRASWRLAGTGGLDAGS